MQISCQEVVERVMFCDYICCFFFTISELKEPFITTMKRKLPFLRGLGLSILVTFALNLSAQSPSGYIADWKGDASAAYTIIHDDYGDPGVDGIWQYADTIAANRGIKFVMGAISSACETNRSIGGYNTPYEYAKNVMIAQHEHEIISHSHDHDCAVGNAGWPADGSVRPCDDFTEYWGESSSYANFNTQLVTAHNSIETGTGHTPVYYIFPYDRFTYIANNKLKELGYLGSRTGWTGPFPANPTYHIEGYEASDVSSFFPDSDGFFRTSVEVFDGVDDDKDIAGQVAELNGEVDNAIASNLWCNRELHNVGSTGWGSVKVESYRQHLTYLKQKVDAGDLWVGTVSEILTYQYQKLKYSSNVNYVSASDKIFVTWNGIGNQYTTPVATYLSPLTIKTPLTMVVDLDGLSGDWGVKQNSVDISSDNFYVQGGKLYINVFPHEGDLEIYKTNGAGNTSPYVDNAVSNYNLNVNFSTFNINLKNVFEDSETDDNTLIYSATGYTGISVNVSNGIATVSASLNWIGTTTVTLTAEDEEGATVSETFDVNVTDPFASQTPFGGVAQSIPGRVEAEDYDEGDEDEAYNEEYSQWEPDPSASQYRPWDPVDVDLIAGTSEYGVGFTVTGEWLEYTIDVDIDGWYTVDLNVAQYAPDAPVVGNIELFIDNVSWMPSTDMTFTSGWSNYEDVTYNGALQLKAGTHVLRVSFVRGNVNLNYIDILTSPVSASYIEKDAFNVYPNPASDILTIDADFETARIYSQTGQLIKAVSDKNVNLAGIAEGIYFVKLDNSSSMVKFAITK